MSERTQTIEIEYVDVKGAKMVILPIARVKAAAESRNKEADALEKEAEEQKKAGEPEAEWKPKLEGVKAGREQTKYMLAAATELRKKLGDRITKQNFQFRPYTWGEKRNARVAASTIDDRSGASKIDLSAFELSLVKSATGLSQEELDALGPQMGEALTREVMERSEPDPSRLDFFDS